MFCNVVPLVLIWIQIVVKLKLYSQIDTFFCIFYVSQTFIRYVSIKRVSSKINKIDKPLKNEKKQKNEIRNKM